MAEALLKQLLSSDKITVNNNITYELLADYEVTGSSVTSVDITGLNIQQNEEVVLVASFINSVASGGVNHYITVNNNITYTNYYVEWLDVQNTSIGAVRYNNPLFSYIFNNNSKLIANINIKLTNNGYFTYQDEAIRGLGETNITLANFYGTSTFTMPSITSIKLIADVASSIGIGSRFQLYKINGGDTTWNIV